MVRVRFGRRVWFEKNVNCFLFRTREINAIDTQLFPKYLDIDSEWRWIFLRDAGNDSPSTEWVYTKLPEMRDKICEAWRRESSRPQESIDPAALRDIRGAIVEIEFIR